MLRYLCMSLKITTRILVIFYVLWGCIAWLLGWCWGCLGGHWWRDSSRFKMFHRNIALRLNLKHHQVVKRILLFVVLKKAIFIFLVNLILNVRRQRIIFIVKLVLEDAFLRRNWSWRRVFTWRDRERTIFLRAWLVVNLKLPILVILKVVISKAMLRHFRSFLVRVVQWLLLI